MPRRKSVVEMEIVEVEDMTLSQYLAQYQKDKEEFAKDYKDDLPALEYKYADRIYLLSGKTETKEVIAYLKQNGDVTIRDLIKVAQAEVDNFTERRSKVDDLTGKNANLNKVDDRLSPAERRNFEQRADKLAKLTGEVLEIKSGSKKPGM